MENPQRHPQELGDESGVRSTPIKKDEVPEMRSPQELYRFLQEKQLRGVDAGKIMDIYEQQEQAREEVTRVIKIPQPPAPRMTMAEALAHETSAGNYGEIIPDLTKDAVEDDGIEDLTAEAEEWTEEDDAAAEEGFKKAA